MRHYCTLFDSKYLPQGLVLYQSLLKHSSEPFVLYILALDDQTLDTLMQMELTNCKVRAVSQVDKLKDLRETRTWQEFCWSAGSCFTELLLSSYPLDDLTYLDADMMFFRDPKIVFDEIDQRSIAVTPHRLIPEKRHLERNGRFNVGWVTFKNTEVGRACLSRWAAQVRERCSADYGCGDQFYLNEWPELYGNECHIIENIGVNAGPWSIGNWKVTEGPRLDGVPLVLYHAHEYIHGQRLTNYDLRPEDREFIYKPYIAAVTAAQERVTSLHIQA